MPKDMASGLVLLSLFALLSWKLKFFDMTTPGSFPRELGLGLVTTLILI